MGLFGGKKKEGQAFEFRVSDSVAVPMRGYLLRLKLLNGEPGIADLGPGKRIKLRSISGRERVIAIKDNSVTQGPASQSRLDRTREFDIVIDAADGAIDGETVDIGWTAAGPE